LHDFFSPMPLNVYTHSSAWFYERLDADESRRACGNFLNISPVIQARSQSNPELIPWPKQRQVLFFC
jgi:hypothetical protein